MRVPFQRSITKAIKDYQANADLERELRIDSWVFSSYRKNQILTDTLEWEKMYLPIDIRGKVVLDVGAGEGETARFFLHHGAKKVIAVEPDTQSYCHLLYNSYKHPQILPVKKKFHPDMIFFCHPDFAKIDVEGYEQQLLDYKLPCPVVVEVHGLQLRDMFQWKGYTIKYANENGLRGFDCTCYAYNIGDTKQ